MWGQLICATVNNMRLYFALRSRLLHQPYAPRHGIAVPIALSLSLSWWLSAVASPVTFTLAARRTTGRRCESLTFFFFAILRPESGFWLSPGRFLTPAAMASR